MAEGMRPSALLFDLDGVFFVGDQAVAGGADVVRWARAEGIPFLFVTNTTSHSRQSLTRKLESFDIVVDPSQLLTPVVAARDLIVERGAEPIAVFLPDESAAEFEGLRRLATTQSQGAAAVVVGDLGEAWDFATLNRAFRLLMAEPPPLLVALGLSRFWADHDGLVLDVGAFVRGLEFAADTQAVVTGKPSASFFHAAATHVGRPCGEIVMVGDDVRSDVGAAQVAGMRGVLVRTGKFAPADLDRGVVPDAVIDSVVDLPEWWRTATAR